MKKGEQDNTIHYIHFHLQLISYLSYSYIKIGVGAYLIFKGDVHISEKVCMEKGGGGREGGRGSRVKISIKSII